MSSSRMSVCAIIAVLLAGGLLTPAAPAAAVAGPAVAAAGASPASSAASERRALVRSWRKAVVGHALSQQEASYVWGGEGPDQFDCSGLVMWAYQQLGISLPHYSGAQMDVARPVERERLRRGDLLFYGIDGSRHVAMYIGNGMQIGANNPRTGVVIDSIDSSYWASSYAGAGRLIHRGSVG